LGPAERKMIGHLLELPETDAAEVMTPRTGLTAISSDATVSAALEMAAKEGHSRIPVFEDDFDHIKGLFHIKDVLAAIAVGSPIANNPVSEHMREAFFVPETVRLPNLFEEMRRRRAHLAVVVDEYGGTAGVVTIEDLLEEIVGEIEDEHDSLDDQPKVHRASALEIIADGGVTIDSLNEEFSVQLPVDESYETLAGLIFDRLGHVPSEGESIPLEGVTLEVLEADDRRIRKVRLVRTPSQPESDAA
ncbi:MAG: HlyC/CorC family transporter, partial [Planctomycetes bacterium]|nr:HlyC/CorC family transporter [Planctomycetota bacterium]